MIKKIASVVAALLFLWLIIYVSLPALSIKYASFLCFIAFVILIGVTVYFFAFNKVEFKELGGRVEVLIQQGQKTYTRVKSEFASPLSIKIYSYTALSALLLVVLSGVLTFASQPIVRTSEYYDVIASRIEEQNFNTDFIELKESTVTSLPNIDSSLAQKKATTLFGETKGFGSEYQLGVFTDQIVDGKFVTVAPIEYNGFFKYNTNKDNGTPGFIIVDKENYDTSNNGTVMYTNYNLKYLPSSYFQTDLLRHVYFNGYANRKVTVSGFELDDDLNPYWIINVYENTVGPYGLKLVSNVLVVNAQTGHIDEYTIDELKEKAPWVDNVQDTTKVMEQVNNYGKYEKGFMNSIFAQSGVTQTTHGSRHLVLNNELYLFTGLTSVGADESISQILLVNKKTLETKIYNVSGATEYVAMSSAEGKLQNYGYDATFPIPVNVNNIPTYFIPLKDSSGLIKHYTYVQISNHTVIGAGNTITEAYVNYVSQLSSTETTNLEDVSGTIDRINFVDGTCYILVNGKIYYTTNFSTTTLVLTQSGDSVDFKVLGNMIVEFTNNAI